MKPILLVSPFLCLLASVVVRNPVLALWPLIISPYPISRASSVYRHERIHLRQQRELLLIGFYVLYLWDWLRGRCMGYSAVTAYLQIRFEQEASDHSRDRDYLETRSRFAWRAYDIRGRQP